MVTARRVMLNDETRPPATSTSLAAVWLRAAAEAALSSIVIQTHAPRVPAQPGSENAMDHRASARCGDGQE